MQVFVVESLYCRENPTKKSASADLSVILIYNLFLFMHQKEQVTSPQACIFLAHPSIILFLFVRQKEQAYLVKHFIRPLLFCINPDLFLSADMFVRACWESRGRTWLRNLVPRPA